MTKPPCKWFSQGRCTLGSKCKFSHIPATHSNPRSTSNNYGGRPASNFLPSSNTKHDEMEELFKRWRYDVPKDAKTAQRAHKLPSSGLARFMQDALRLIESSEDKMQAVVINLATEGGLSRVREMLDQDFANMEDTRLEHVWKAQLLSLLRILTYPSILRSSVVESHHVTLCNFLYGINGKYAVAALTAAVRCLSPNPSAKQSDIGVTVIALALILERNSSAQVNPDLQALAPVLTSLLDINHGRPIERAVRTVSTLLKLGGDLPEEGAQHKTQDRSKLNAVFSIEQDLPGELSKHGPRHDNDRIDIQDIRILPTMLEIHSARPEYLPRDDSSMWHKPGLSGLLDRHFRLVREDTVGQLRDAAKFELERLVNPVSTAVDRRQRARTYAYRAIKLQKVAFEQKGLLFVLSFDQPRSFQNTSIGQRATWWKESNRLTSDSLLCLLSSAGQATFLTVASPSMPFQFRNSHNRRNSWEEEEDEEEAKPLLHEQYSLSKTPDRAYVIAQLANPDPAVASWFLRSWYSSDAGVDYSLIEFPGVLLPAFEPTLTALQSMADSRDMPFRDLVAQDGGIAESRPPAYSSNPGFTYDLKSLFSDSGRGMQHLVAARSPNLTSILESSSLDGAQAKAVEHALKSSLALIQGPPGTGKSYTGIKIIQTLLDSKKSGVDLGPIVCVCFTNHALDQLLEHLVDAGVQQMVRMGSRSQSQRLASINLRLLSKSVESTRADRKARWECYNEINSIANMFESLLDSLPRTRAQEEGCVRVFLQDNHPELYAEIFNAVDEGGFAIVRRSKKNNSPLRSWLRGKRQQRVAIDAQNGGNHDNIPSQQDLQNRQELYDSWLQQVTEDLYLRMEAQLDAFNGSSNKLNSLRGDVDLRVLSGASVIGVTTTGLARNLKHLRKLTSKVLVVEEAGEVLEAHLLTTMLPSLEHAILIGDHQQLRPKVANYDLSVENPHGQVALDISLFERLVKPREGQNTGLPFVTLDTQRRMHPAISQLIRSTLYPTLEDDSSVQRYPPVTGMRHRLFWIDHLKNEDRENEDQHATSHANQYEVELVAALVRHIVRQGVYSANDIAILTPYLGQLRSLRQKLSGLFDIILSDRDLEELAREDVEPKNSSSGNVKFAGRPLITRGNLLQALRLTTVDNFQGEEAKVVIISLVRSNKNRGCGFLRTSNRINVLLSRAQHGMYIIGNSATCSHVPMWNDVLQLLRAQGNIGSQLELCCPRHPDLPLLVTEPEDFNLISPEAGCNLMCGKQLKCGHGCPSKCHPDTLHDSVVCQKDCPRLKKGCEHPCKLPCGQLCAAKCTETVHCEITLACGHMVTSLPCWQHQDPTTYFCEVPVHFTAPGCGHIVTKKCCSSDDRIFHCTEPCGAELECGHECKNQCNTCRPSGLMSQYRGVDHGECRRKCGRNFAACEHSCQQLCHSGKECEPCSAPCTSRCTHSRCSKLCSDPCTPCTEEHCSSSCPHSTCQMPCGAPCDWVPCSKRCEKNLSCGHQCPSMCGEVCPSKDHCQLCASDSVRGICVDLITMETFAEVDLNKNPCIILPCGHIFSVETLDGQMDVPKHYRMDTSQEPNMPVALDGDLLPLSYDKPKTCPNCRGSLRSIARYGRIVRRSLLDVSTIKFIAWSQHSYSLLAKQLQTEQGAFLETVGQAVLRTNVAINGTRDLQKTLGGDRRDAYQRYKAILRLRTSIKNFSEKVSREEQPFQKVRDLVEATRRRKTETNIPVFEYDKTILQTRAGLLTHALLIRCDLIIITDVLSRWENMSHSARTMVELHVDLSSTRQDCAQIFDEAETSMNVLQQAEADIFWAHLAALEYNSPWKSDSGREKMEALQKEALEHLDRAQKLCARYPGQTKSVVSEINQVRKMLRQIGSISDSEMRMVVATMDKEFSGTGHWYRCVNGHPFTIGECGAPMQQATCPQCGAAIGGQHHQAVAGVTHAGDIERQFGRLRL